MKFDIAILTVKRITGVFLILTSALLQLSCVVVGYRSGSGWFFWPGGTLGIFSYSSFGFTSHAKA